MGTLQELRDKNYFRMMSVGQLVELTKTSGGNFLLVIAERLEELEAAERAIADLSQEINDLEERLSLHREDAERLQRECDELTITKCGCNNERGPNE